MSLYVLQENQKLLWDTISKHALFDQMKKNDYNKSEKWFRNIIEDFYNKNDRSLSKDQLRTLNKETIKLMIHNLKEQSSYQPLSTQNHSSFSNSYTPINSLTTNASETNISISERKQNELNSEFQNRQKEFESFHKRPTMKEIDFRENDKEDVPIENIDELLQAQLKEREYDLQPNTEENIKIETIDLGNNENEKKVTWSPNIETSKMDNMEKKINDFMIQVQTQINSLRNEIEFIKNEHKLKKEDNVTSIISRLQSIDQKNNDNSEDVEIEQHS